MHAALFLVACAASLGAPWHTGLSRTVHGQKRQLYAGHPMRYKGGFFGVQAELLLYRKADYAVIKLKGIPVGGSLNGMARFKDDGWNVELDERLQEALSRRMVQVVGVGAFHDYKKVWVMLKLPLGIGRRQLVLQRVDLKEEEDI